MPAFSLTVRGAEDCIKELARVGKRVDDGLKSATREATKFVAGEVGKRTLIPRRLNIQDSAAARYLSNRKPIRTYVDVDRKLGLIELQSHWSPARTPGLQKNWTAQGEQFGKLLRKGLWIPRNSWIKGAGGKFKGRKKSTNTNNSRDGYIYMAFSKNPDLKRWANDRSRGLQLMRHAIRISGAVGQALITAPSLERNRAKVLAFFHDATRRVFTGR